MQESSACSKRLKTSQNLCGSTPNESNKPSTVHNKEHHCKDFQREKLDNQFKYNHFKCSSTLQISEAHELKHYLSIAAKIRNYFL